jgi:choline dehydrogenase-like flavoprotein
VLIDLRSKPHRGILGFDVCIVGGGPAGLTLARELGRVGRGLAVLESGYLEVDAPTQFLKLGSAVGPIADRHPTYLATSRVRALGGSQLAWGGWCTPLLRHDLEKRDWVEHSGWPIALAELTRYYASATRICMIHDSMGVVPPESPVHGGELVERRYGFAPRRITARDVLLPALAHAPNVRIFLGAHVRYIERAPSGGEVSAFHVATLAGESFEVRAKQYVLAAGGIENPRLMLASERADGRPFGSGSDLIGRFFMEHPHVHAGHIQLRGGLSAWRRYFGGRDPELGHAVRWGLALPAHTQARRGLLNAALELWPEEENPAEAPIHPARLVLRAEQSPNPESRIVLTSHIDPIGLPMAHLEWSLKPIDWSSIYSTARSIAEALERHAGARFDLTIQPEIPWPPMPMMPDYYEPWGCHHMGTTRMSESPASGVVDPNGRVHGVANLYVAGSSAFPTGGYANPTFTVIALALRLADHLKLGR